MGDKSKIEWTEASWNPIRGCTRVSAGCQNCYAERLAARFNRTGQAFDGLAKQTPDGPRWTGKIMVVENKLEEPLRWRRPRRIFVNSVSDLFHEGVSDETIDRIFAVMAVSKQHTFQILTKRPERMLKYFEQFPDRGFRVFDIAAEINERMKGTLGKYGTSFSFPLSNVWLGVSVEDQKTADERIPLLLKTLAVVRWISAEPLLGKIELRQQWRDYLEGWETGEQHEPYCDWSCSGCPIPVQEQTHKLDWVVVGGESGPGARPFDLRWPRSIIEQCHAAGTPIFVKQLGSNAIGYNGTAAFSTESRKGGDPAEWPDDLRVREFPYAR